MTTEALIAVKTTTFNDSQDGKTPLVSVIETLIQNWPKKNLACGGWQ